MSKKCWLKTIILHKSPGFASGTFPPVEKLGEHLNVIWGPNAVGKSTLGRAMRALIWEHKASGAVEAEGILQTPDSDWNLSLSQGKLTQTRLRDNQTIRLPGSNDELSESYWFTLHELLQEDDRSTDAFLRQVRTSMQGGVDLDDASRNAGGISSFANSNISQARKVRQASEDLKQIHDTQGAHQGIQDRIGILQQELGEEDILTKKRAHLQTALFFFDTEHTIKDDERLKAEYHQSITRIDASSPQRLDDLKTAQNKAQKAWESLDHSERTLRNDFEGCRIGAQQLDDLDKPKRLSNRLGEYEQAIRTQAERTELYHAAEQSLHEWEEQHSWLMSDPPTLPTLQSYSEKLRILASECEPLRCSVEANSRVVKALGEPEVITHSVKDLSLLQLRLTDWTTLSWKLLGIPQRKPMAPKRKTTVMASILSIGLVASLSALLIHPLFSFFGFVGICIAVFFLIPSSAKNPAYKQAEANLQKSREEAEHLCIALGKAVPSSWTISECQDLVVNLGEEIVAIHQIEQQNQRRIRAKTNLDTSLRELAQWYKEWEEAAIAIGLQEALPRLEGAQFFHFGKRLDMWSTYRVSYEKALGALTQAQQRTQQTLQALQAELDTTESDSAALKAMSENLHERFDKAHSLQIRIKENQELREKAESDMQSCKDALKEFWVRVGLEQGNEKILRDFAVQRAEYDKLALRIQYQHELYESKAREATDAFDMFQTYTRQDIEEQVMQVETSLEGLRRKREELGGLRATFQALKFGSDLSMAQKKQEEALLELEAFRSEQVMARMIASLSHDLKDESEKQFQPQVLKHASKWFSDSTNHRYTLSANNTGFFATDTIMAKNYTLDELSSGTRIQLLFSIRMAFITMQEETSDVNLPIFLDELLANSDDDRALAIIQAIGNIAKDRQVFYMTAQRDEVEKLKTLATSEVTVLPLEDLKRDFRVAKDPLKRYVIARKEVLPPIADYQEYGNVLSVSGPSLWGTIEALHSWHLFADSEALYDALQQGLASIGQLVSFKGEKNPILMFRMELLKAAQIKAQQGRSRIVHLADLNDPALELNRSARFWDQIQEVVGPEGCTGKELLEAIHDKRVQRFTEANLDMLSTWLFDNRFVTDKKSKSSQAILEDLFVAFEALTVGSEEELVVRRWLYSAIG